MSKILEIDILTDNSEHLRKVNRFLKKFQNVKNSLINITQGFSKRKKIKTSFEFHKRLSEVRPTEVA